MKIQELAIIFVIIILPISIVLSEYTQVQIETISMQTEYDAQLTSATLDAIKAFQINTMNSSTSDLTNSKIRDIEASVSTFKTSLKSVFGLNGYTEDQMNEYIPALVYTMYDGFYIYSKYNNQNYVYQTDSEGNYVTDEYGEKIGLDNNEENVYGLKPYITYSARYIRGDIDVVITYSLDNYITVQGWANKGSGKEYINISGYLVDGIEYNEATDKVTYNGIEIEQEELYETLPTVSGLGLTDTQYKYIRFNGTKYYYDAINDRVFYFLNGEMIAHENGTDAYTTYRNLIDNNNFAKEFYKEAYTFTTLFKSYGLASLEYQDASDYTIDDNGDVVYINLWEDDDAYKNEKIFDFNTIVGSSADPADNIECEKSNFNQHRLAIIKNKIRTNLSIAVANYNSELSSEIQFSMPELSEEEWSHIMNNISLISFVQGINIGGKTYNGYTIVNNSESKEVVNEENIYIIGQDGFYHRIGDRYLTESDSNIGTSTISAKSSGRLNLDFNRQNLKDENGNTIYYYPLNYYASYSSVVNQNDCDVYDDIYEYVSTLSDSLKKAFYTALGRERYGMYKTEI